MSTQFNFLVLNIEPYLVLPFRARVDLEVMAKKGHSTFLKAPALLEAHHQIVSCHIKKSHWEGGLAPSQDANGVFYEVVSPDRVLSIGQIELNSILMLNRIV